MHPLTNLFKRLLHIHPLPSTLYRLVKSVFKGLLLTCLWGAALAVFVYPVYIGATVFAVAFLLTGGVAVAAASYVPVRCVSTHSANTPCQYALSIHPANTPCMSIRPINTPYHTCYCHPPHPQPRPPPHPCTPNLLHPFTPLSDWERAPSC